ncbi:hypothetical protein [Halobacillus litoralis]|uniref:hypothetical protein n=1 Tax=Halobacillus litoralis TaxID=45668 RepID=UPI003532716B
MTRNRAFFMIFLGASLWGIIGLFVNELYEYGFSPHSSRRSPGDLCDGDAVRLHHQF